MSFMIIASPEIKVSLFILKILKDDLFNSGLLLIFDFQENVLDCNLINRICSFNDHCLFYNFRFSDNIALKK